MWEPDHLHHVGLDNDGTTPDDPNGWSPPRRSSPLATLCGALTNKRFWCLFFEKDLEHTKISKMEIISEDSKMNYVIFKNPQFQENCAQFCKNFPWTFWQIFLIFSKFFLANCQTLNKFTTIAITRGGGAFRRLWYLWWSH